VLTPLSKLLNAAARRLLIPANPFHLLERDERPKLRKGATVNVLGDDEVGKLLDAVETQYRALYGPVDRHEAVGAACAALGRRAVRAQDDSRAQAACP
jgi:hypothetical protein